MPKPHSPDLLEINVDFSNTSAFTQVQRPSWNVASVALQREKIERERMIVVGAAGLAMAGYGAWHPDDQPLRVEAVVPRREIWDRWTLRNYPIRGMLKKAPDNLSLGPKEGPIVDIAVTPEGTEHSFDDLLTHAVIDPTEGWLRLLPGATAGLMALSGNPAKIATVLRAHKAAFAWQGPELPHAYDPEWLQGVTRAVVAARANPVLRQTRGIGSLVTGGFGQDPAFGFLPFELKAPSSNFQLPQQ